MREAGLPLDSDIRPGSTLSSGLELATFRIAQEGLTNVRKHAGDVPTRLMVVRDTDELRIEVHNEPPVAAVHTKGLSTGHGLVGARERVRAAGGTLQAGPTASGGFELIARLPLGSIRGSRS
jgi:signal transduction histidine kinase